MEYFRKIIFLVLLMSILAVMFIGDSKNISALKDGEEKVTTIKEWELLWEQPEDDFSFEEVNSFSNEYWLKINPKTGYPSAPKGINKAWIKIKVPESNEMRPALIINKLYAKKITIYIDGHVIYDVNRNYSLNIMEIMIPIERSEFNSTMLIEVSNNIDKIGIYEEIKLGEFTSLQKSFIKSDLLELVLGSSLILIAFFMIVSILFINRSFQPGWYSLFLVMLSVGVMILTYSSFLDKYFPEYGTFINVGFDIASSVLMPAFYYFFEQVLGKGPYGLITKYKKVQTGFAVIYTIALVFSFYSEFVYKIYYTHGYIVFGVSIIIGNILLIVSLIYECKNRNKEAIILSIGICIFAAVGLFEVIWYMYIDRMYSMNYWKISILFFISSLIIILVRRVMMNYHKALEYSRHIEIFNEELQRSEKIELISNLAASIAHEVRNPLQVTRGFLQLLGGRLHGTNEKDYMNLAIDELDRASEIITDFLTFAKPDLGNTLRLNVKDELNQIVAILAPWATLQGGVIIIQSSNDVFIQGNPSKFKQAIINIVKNSIEACGENGEISVEILKNDSDNSITIKIKDNGEGIDPEDIKRLGEPYYTKKTKGTGLGLMVTFRIIEAMNGVIMFESQKGVGTEVNITLPTT
jgi:two-component system sporulation sensor kinase B